MSEEGEIIQEQPSLNIRTRKFLNRLIRKDEPTMNSGNKFKSYKPEHSTDKVIDLTQKLLKMEVKNISRVDYGEINAVYFVKLQNGKEVVIRISPRERGWNSFSQEAWAFGKCRAVGVPTPQVLAVDTKPQDFPEAYMISRRLPGVTGNEAKKGLTEEQLLDVYRQLGHYYYLIHSIKAPGFGQLEQKGQEFVGRYSNQWEYIEHEIESGWWVKHALCTGLITKSKLSELKSRFERNRNLFDLEQASLVHGDLSTSLKNVILDGSEITGIVDMENVKVTDPVADFAYFHFWGGQNTEYFEALKSGYDDQGFFDGNFMKKVYLYQLLLSHSLTTYYDKRGNQGALEYVQSKISAIEAELDALE
jgi:aminoglycoside phosphotransferase (APT) family kinase protein